MSAPISDTEAALRFLDHMFGPECVRHLVAIDENGMVATHSFEPSNVEPARAWIEARQGRANLYYSVNELKPSISNRKATKKDMARALHLHVDVDDPKALSRISEFTPKPTAVVFSGGGYQAFWKLAEPAQDLARVERINAELALQLGGDRCQDIDRIMRLPGTINLPNGKKRKTGRVPALAYVVETVTDWSRPYALDDFDEGGDEDLDPANVLPRDVTAVDVDHLPGSLSPETIELIQRGDAPSAPIRSKDAHFRSRSEAVWRVACELARVGCSAEAIAGILINPAHGISQSVLEKKRPNDYALRQAKQALSVVSSNWPDVTKEGRPRPSSLSDLKPTGADFC
jgi:RepB DNA-primase from phage plasmid